MTIQQVVLEIAAELRVLANSSTTCNTGVDGNTGVETDVAAPTGSASLFMVSGSAVDSEAIAPEAEVVENDESFVSNKRIKTERNIKSYFSTLK